MCILYTASPSNASVLGGGDDTPHGVLDNYSMGLSVNKIVPWVPTGPIWRMGPIGQPMGAIGPMGPMGP